MTAKRRRDLGIVALPQLALARLIDAGELERQLRFLGRCHRRRHGAMTEAIRHICPAASCTAPRRPEP